MKTCLYSFDPLKPHLCTVKLGFTGVYINFLISAQKHRLWVLVRTPSLIYVLSKNMKTTRIFHLKDHFLVVKFSIYLNRRVFVMLSAFVDSEHTDHSTCLCSLIEVFAFCLRNYLILSLS